MYIYIHIYVYIYICNISRNKANQIMKFDQLNKYNVKKIFPKKS